MNDKDKIYDCVIADSVNEVNLHSKRVTLKGTCVKLPSDELFVMEDGSVYVQTKKQGEHVSYTSLSSLIQAVKSTKIIENFSK
jgi:hypothetical protein